MSGAELENLMMLLRSMLEVLRRIDKQLEAMAKDPLR